MKDQVDALAECGVSAVRLDSSMSPNEQKDVIDAIHARAVNCYTVAGTVLTDSFINILQKTNYPILRSMKHTASACGGTIFARNTVNWDNSAISFPI